MTVPVRRTFRFVNRTLRPDHDTEYAATSPPSNDPAEPQSWAFTHLREHPGHTSYAEVIERPWVMWEEGPT
ncbi:hypothetical protein OG194_13520 [Streptomyces sp. NBC_01288]|uniref:DUF7848 domain-containing protein n=1 Tax=Streptomyces sp. NBC_01288 TaxID=2903814 RepID=UPI002E14B671|nr:hypothetical protein OG194_13520 [Streptomyces sp. NBC_01288]